MENPHILLVSPPGSSCDGLHIIIPALLGQVSLMVARNSSQAVRLASKAQPDLIIINTEIGYTESKQILTKLLALNYGDKTLILSEAVQWQHWKNSLQPCQVLLKGFSFQEFKTVIEIFLTKKSYIQPDHLKRL